MYIRYMSSKGETGIASPHRHDMAICEFRGGGRRDPCKRTGTFTCGRCNYCQFLNTSKNIILPNGERYEPKHYANCQTPSVVYIRLCERDPTHLKVITGVSDTKGPMRGSMVRTCQYLSTTRLMAVS